jgi:hypothetical protein
MTEGVAEMKGFSSGGFRVAGGGFGTNGRMRKGLRGRRVLSESSLGGAFVGVSWSATKGR